MQGISHNEIKHKYARYNFDIIIKFLINCESKISGEYLYFILRTLSNINNYEILIGHENLLYYIINHNYSSNNISDIIKASKNNKIKIDFYIDYEKYVDNMILFEQINYIENEEYLWITKYEKYKKIDLIKFNIYKLIHVNINTNKYIRIIIVKNFDFKNDINFISFPIFNILLSQNFLYIQNLSDFIDNKCSIYYENINYIYIKNQLKKIMNCDYMSNNTSLVKECLNFYKKLLLPLISKYVNEKHQYKNTITIEFSQIKSNSIKYYINEYSSDIFENTYLIEKRINYQYTYHHFYKIYKKELESKSGYHMNFYLPILTKIDKMNVKINLNSVYLKDTLFIENLIENLIYCLPYDNYHVIRTMEIKFYKHIRLLKEITLNYYKNDSVDKIVKYNFDTKIKKAIKKIHDRIKCDDLIICDYNEFASIYSIDNILRQIHNYYYIMYLSTYYNNLIKQFNNIVNEIKIYSKKYYIDVSDVLKKLWSPYYEHETINYETENKVCEYYPVVENHKQKLAIYYKLKYVNNYSNISYNYYISYYSYHDDDLNNLVKITYD